MSQVQYSCPNCGKFFTFPAYESNEFKDVSLNTTKMQYFPICPICKRKLA